MSFNNRADAGRRLGARLDRFKGTNSVVLGLPRGGVPVAAAVAEALGVPLDVILVRKLGVPYQPELAMGAIGEGGVRVVDSSTMRASGVTEHELAAVEARERTELDRRAQHLRGGRALVDLTGRTALVIDDGIATGSTARAACRIARARGARRVVLATPVAPPEAEAELTHDSHIDDVVCLQTPHPFRAVGEWYDDFSQTSDDEVLDCLARADARAERRSPPEPLASHHGQDLPRRPARDEEVLVITGSVDLPGHLAVPPGATGVIVFAHGSGSSRHSPRNRFVADVLHQHGLGTLLLDLLTGEEEVDRAHVFDIEMLARRLAGAARWLRSVQGVADLPVGLFGASTGAAAALAAATDPRLGVRAIVSRGGRPDLAGPRLGRVTASTLLLVGARDEIVLELNRDAQALLRCKARLEIVSGATHLFEEPGTLRSAADLAAGWFVDHLAHAELSDDGDASGYWG
jgi:putative phosphoribosyl transferase